MKEARAQLFPTAIVARFGWWSENTVFGRLCRRSRCCFGAVDVGQDIMDVSRSQMVYTIAGDNKALRSKRRGITGQTWQRDERNASGTAEGQKSKDAPTDRPQRERKTACLSHPIAASHEPCES